MSAVRMLAEASIRRIENLLGAGKKIPTHRPTRDTTLEADALGRTRRQTGHTCRRGTVQACPCLPGDCRVYRFPGEARACNSPGETATTLLREAMADPCQGDLRQATGQGKAAPPVMGLGLEAIQGMTNAMNAIANQVIRDSGRSGRNAGWPYFDGTLRDYPAFKRKFESFQMNYHRGTPTRELFQQFREMCLPEKLSTKIK